MIIEKNFNYFEAKIDFGHLIFFMINQELNYKINHHLEN